MFVKLYVTGELREIPISCLELSNRSANALYRTNCTNVGDIIDKWHDLTEIRGLGDNSIKEIKNAVVEESLSLMTKEQVVDFFYDLVLRNPAEKLKKLALQFKKFEDQSISEPVMQAAS
ncbi:MAG: hypothetical protein K6G83_04800 [Lachnospiraceae bacterium]|nr:hypothetical protein [Lachnospiraceae bacterium]